ncbi:ExbD/TolR family protein [Aquimarina pacifica]|uniref:ExbD/TolR family protein n=1 Tax=Aquimarina pacifica TaxID=1296415 RepID=UPI000470629E|nr:biopolymer transporter ExbD [Aquimarina pacifica]
MNILKKRKTVQLPEISTASLPDIVFMLLFFFMVATVMRKDVLLIENKLPVANQVEKLDKKDLVMHIYAGKPSSRYQMNAGSEARVQLNDKFASVNDIKAFVFAERDAKNEQLLPFLTTALKIDKETNMGLVGDIKKELREVHALKLNYITKTGEAQDNFSN